MIFVAISLGALALVFQIQASAWHRGLQAIISDIPPFRIGSEYQARKADYSLLQPPYVKFRSGLAVLLMLAGSISVCMIGEWWWSLVCLFGLGTTANLLSRVLFPKATDEYWSSHVVMHLEAILSAALVAGDVARREQCGIAISSLRYTMGIGSDSSATVIQQAYQKLADKTKLTRT